MARERLYLFDTTLRDGAQTNGVDFTLADKLAIAGMLDELGIDYVEGGYPGANPTDTELFSAGPRTLERHVHRLRHDAPARPLGLERSGPRGAARSQGRRDLLCRQGLGLPCPRRARDDARRRTSPRSATACAPRRPRAARCCSTASISSTATRPIRNTRSPAPRRPTMPARAGSCCATPTAARCRTRSRRSSREVSKVIPGDHVGIHAHNDTEQAVANSLAAVRAGARQIQGTLNGLGERCGNANLVSIIPTLKLKPDFAERFEIGVSDEQLKALAHASHALDDMLNRAPNRHAPYVGESAFATKAGIHASAIMKDPATYEHVAPESGRQQAQASWCPTRPADRTCSPSWSASASRSTRTIRASRRLLDEVKEREAQGYAYEARRRLVRAAGAAHARHGAEIFRRRRISTSRSSSATTPLGELVTVAEAVVKVKVGGETLISAGEGNGPVNALDVALRKDLGKYQSYHRGPRSSSTTGCVSSMAAPTR